MDRAVTADGNEVGDALADCCVDHGLHVRCMFGRVERHIDPRQGGSRLEVRHGPGACTCCPVHDGDPLHAIPPISTIPRSMAANASEATLRYVG